MKEYAALFNYSKHNFWQKLDVARQSKAMLYDYLKGKGLTTRELQYAGIPQGFFDDVASRATKNDSFLAMSKPKDGERTLKQSSLSQAGDIHFQVHESTRRLQRTDFGKLREPYKWPVLNEQFSADVVRQSLDASCVSAVGEMLSQGTLTEQKLIAKLGAPSDIKYLPRELGPEWTSAKGPTTLTEIGSNGPWAAEMFESHWTKFPKEPHVVVVDGLTPTGNVSIRDPLEGTRHEMTVGDFLKTWTGRCVYKRFEYK